MTAFIPHALPLAKSSKVSNACPRMCAPSPSLYEEHFPAATRYQAPHIVFCNKPEGFVVDMCPVAMPSVSEDSDPEAPKAELYEKSMPNANFCAPFLELNAPKEHVSVEMRRVADSPELDKGGPDPALYSKWFGSEGRPLFVAPFVEAKYEGGIGVEMKPVPLNVPNPNAKFDQYMHMKSLNKAPVISFGDKVIKLQMQEIVGNADEYDRPEADGFLTFRKHAFNQAPYITFPRDPVRKDLGIRVEMKEVDGNTVGFNCAPVISFDGTKGILLRMEAIVGDPSVVKLEKETEEIEETYSNSWKPSSVLEKVWV